MKPRQIVKITTLIAILLVFVSCKNNEAVEETTLDYAYLNTLPEKNISYNDQVQPILANRCVVCHGCYDAPCQLKLSSIEGLQRGANKEVVYAPRRLNEANHSRLFIDANSTTEWRDKGFYSVLNETKSATNPAENLSNSILYRMLRLKQQHPQAKIGKLDAKIELGLDRKLQCPKTEEFEQFAEKSPLSGMPYGMPNLSDQEHKTLVQWLAQGSPAEKRPAPSAQSQKQVEKWEAFFNQPEKKNQLVSRYIYEHLFLAHIHFKDAPSDEFYRLVRSKTDAGKDIEEIATSRPYDSPYDFPYDKKKPETFFYRLKPYLAEKVIKEHKVYEFSPKKMARYRELFMGDDYQVKNLPSYDPMQASNPLKTFKDIPAKSRYKFLLDSAFFFVEGFIKGPVCRGQVALSVIEDHFWLLFLAMSPLNVENSRVLNSATYPG